MAKTAQETRKYLIRKLGLHKGSEIINALGSEGVAARHEAYGKGWDDAISAYNRVDIKIGAESDLVRELTRVRYEIEGHTLEDIRVMIDKPGVGAKTLGAYLRRVGLEPKRRRVMGKPCLVWVSNAAAIKAIGKSEAVIKALEDNASKIEGNPIVIIKKMLDIEGMTAHRVGALLRAAGYAPKSARYCGKPCKIWVKT